MVWHFLLARGILLNCIQINYVSTPFDFFDGSLIIAKIFGIFLKIVVVVISYVFKMHLKNNLFKI